MISYTYLILYILSANADIYFDDTLRRFGDISTLNLHNEVLALLKWMDINGSSSLSLTLRTDSQDAWIFQTPLNSSIINQSNFVLGTFIFPDFFLFHEILYMYKQLIH